MCYCQLYKMCYLHWDSFNQAAIDYWIRKSNKDKIKIIYIKKLLLKLQSEKYIFLMNRK